MRHIPLALTLGLLAATAQAKSPTHHPVTEVLLKAGLKDCAERSDQISSFLTSGTGTTSGAFIFLPTAKDASTDSISVSFEIQTPQSLGYATASFSQTSDKECHAVYETVTHWDAPCQDVYALGYAQNKPAGAIHKRIDILTGLGEDARIFLMPGSKGCVVIKKEMLRAPPANAKDSKDASRSSSGSSSGKKR